MRTALFNEVSVFNRNSMKRMVALAALSLSAIAAAQPANDLCANAEVLNITGSAAVTSTTTGGLQLAAAAAETVFSCTTSVKNTVWYQFTSQAAGTYRVETCGPVTNVDTVLAVYTGTCGALTAVPSGCNDTGSGSNCVSDASAVNITATAGTTYYVQVALWATATITPTSVVSLTVTPPAVAPPNEACGGAEVVVPNGTTPVFSSQARTFAAAAAVEEPFACLATPTLANRSVWYSVTPTVTGTYRLESCNVFGNTVSDSVMAVYEGTCGALTTSAAACNNDSCSSRSALQLVLLAGTTYYVQLAKNGSLAPTVGNDGLQLAVSQIINGPTDLCSATSPQLTLNQGVTISSLAAPDGGHSVAQNNAQLDAGACFTGVGQTTSNLGPGRDVAYQFRSGNAGRYSFRLGTLTNSINGLLYLSDSCVPVSGVQTSTYGVPQCIAASNRTFSGADEQVSCVDLAANQTVYVWVDESSLSTLGGTASLEVSRCALEVEPNNTPATASGLFCATTGAINVTSDIDFFTIGAHPVGTRVYAMAEGNASNSNDFDLRLTNGTRTLEFDNADLTTTFGSSAPVIAGGALTAEPVYLRVTHSAGTAAEPYILYTQLQRAPPSPETEPNETMATASTSPTNHFTGSITDGGSDVDVYSFSANAGDLIFAALDVVPDRTDAGPTPFNLVMSLVDSTNAVLLTVDDANTAVSYTAGTTLLSTSPAFPAEGLVYRAPATGTYGIRVGKVAGALPNPYNLSVSVGCADTAPTLTALTPGTGSPSGGQLVTLTGTNFSSRSVVRFGGNVALVTSITGTELVVISPPSASSGDVAVSVTNAPGLLATLDPGFTYDDPPGIPPNLVSLSPTFGPVTGGTVVTLNGTVFRRDAGVYFDVGGTSVAAASVTFNTAARLTVTTPPQLEGVADVRVVNFDGLSSQLDAGFTFEGPPSVTSLAPTSGLIAGGLTITINGRNFRPGTTVRVGTTLATAVTIAPGGLSLTAVTPSALVNGPVDVVVRTTDTQQATVTAGFTYLYPAPTIASVTPSSGYAVGNQPITIVGTNFFTGVTLSIGGAPATMVVRNSGGTQVTAITPAGTPGLADVTITNVDAQTVTRTGGFRYVPAPTVTAISPTNGKVQGGTRITISGTNFLAGAQVQLGGVPAFAVDVASPTSITAVSNSGMAGRVDVRVINPDLQVGTLSAAYTYDGAPLLTSLSPTSGVSAGGDTITLTGAGFLPGATVVFGTSPATMVTVNSPTELTAVTPMRPVGVVSVTVANVDNQSSVLQRAYRFVSPPTVSALTPNAGDVAGNTLVRLTGTGFTANTLVSFGGVASQQVSLVSATELDAVTPAHAPGAVDVTVTTDGASATLTGGFTYTRGAPTLAVLAPDNGPITGGTLLTLQGSGFAPGATVTIGGLPATNVVVVSGLLARVVTPAHAAGAVDVVFTNDDAQSVTLAGGYTYVAPTSSGTGILADGGSGGLGADPVVPEPVPGGVSCGCTSTSFDGSMFSFAGMGLLLVLSRRRRRS